MKKASILLSFIYNVAFISYAQNNITTNYLLQRIAAQQVQNDPYFMSGIFPSYISHKQKFSTKKGNNNIFYNGLIGYTFKSLRSKLTATDNLLADSILIKSVPLFSHFKNKKGRETYNFWRTDSSFVFPYGGWMKIIHKKPEVPDDLDATVVSYTALNTPDSIAVKVHEIQQQYINSNPNKLRVDNQIYQQFPTYSTWYGKSFPVVFDVCVLANILSFVQLNHLKWTAADSSALQLIITSISNKDYQKHPLSVSPYYGKTAIILYHLSRLMVIKKIPALELIKSQLINDALERLKYTDNFIEKLLLSNAILKWGKNVPALLVPSIDEIEKNNYPFFIGNIPSYLPKAIRHLMIDLKLGIFYHYCPAYNDALLLEYLVLKK